MHLNYFPKTSSRNIALLEMIKKDILKNLQIKGIDLRKVRINLRGENNCLKVFVCLNACTSR